MNFQFQFIISEIIELKCIKKHFFFYILSILNRYYIYISGINLFLNLNYFLIVLSKFVVLVLSFSKAKFWFNPQDGPPIFFFFNFFPEVIQKIVIKILYSCLWPQIFMSSFLSKRKMY